jgi:hypothetical protein
MRSLSTRAAGLLILIGGIWGGFAPFVGPYFHFVLGPDKTWTWTSGRLWLNVIPGIVAVIAGLMLLRSGPRTGGRLGALLAIGAGAWFAVGPDISQFWHAGGAQGIANGAKTTRIFEMLAFHTGLGVAIATLGGYALPGLLLARRRAVTGVAAEEGTTATGRRVEPVEAGGEPVTAGGEPVDSGRESVEPGRESVEPGRESVEPGRGPVEPGREHEPTTAA